MRSLRAPLRPLLTCVLSGVIFSACSGGGGGKSSGVVTPPTNGFTSLGTTAELRPDLLTGASVPTVSLQDQLTHTYRFPGIPGATYALDIDTLPSTRDIRVEVIEIVQGGQYLFAQNVTTPFQTQITAVSDVPLEVRVFDFNQGGVTLTRLRVTPSALPYNTGQFRVFVHLCGDSFAGLGINNDLATPADETAFVAALLNGVNGILPPDVQVDVNNSGLARRSTAQVAAAAPSLVINGQTVLPATSSEEDNLAQLGIPESDPSFGLAADVFVLHSPNPASPGGTGSCDCVPAGQGGVFRGRGPDHSLFLRVFDINGQPRTLAELQNTLTHELGHFLSLRHPTEASFSVDDLSDTPFSQKATEDLNGNNTLDPNETSGPDATNVMFLFSGNKFVWTSQQRSAMRAYLGLRQH